jgi:hypothetical protein
VVVSAGRQTRKKKTSGTAYKLALDEDSHETPQNFVVVAVGELMPPLLC